MFSPSLKVLIFLNECNVLNQRICLSSGTSNGTVDVAIVERTDVIMSLRSQETNTTKSLECSECAQDASAQELA